MTPYMYLIEHTALLYVLSVLFWYELSLVFPSFRLFFPFSEVSPVSEPSVPSTDLSDAVLSTETSVLPAHPPAFGLSQLFLSVYLFICLIGFTTRCQAIEGLLSSLLYL